MAQASSEKSRARWLARRGMKELDVLLEGYIERRFDQAPESERQAFISLLQKEDPEILAWLLGQSSPPAELADVVARLQRHP